MSLAVALLATVFGTGGSTADSSPITPADGSLLVMCSIVQDTSGQAGAAADGDCGDEDGHYSFLLRKSIGFADNGHPVRSSIYTAAVTTGLSSTFYSGIGGTGATTGFLYQVTGQHATTPIGATGSGFNTSQNATLSLFNSTQNNSISFVCGGDDNERSVGTWSSTDCTQATHDFSTLQVHFAQYKNAVTPTAGSAVTANVQNGVGSVVMNWAALEIVPAVSAAFLARAYYDSLLGRVKNV